MIDFLPDTATITSDFLHSFERDSKFRLLVGDAK